MANRQMHNRQNKTTWQYARHTDRLLDGLTDRQMENKQTYGWLDRKTASDIYRMIDENMNGQIDRVTHKYAHLQTGRHPYRNTYKRTTRHVEQQTDK
jgi:hypothetical protein